MREKNKTQGHFLKAIGGTALSAMLIFSAGVVSFADGAESDLQNGGTPVKETTMTADSAATQAAITKKPEYSMKDYPKSIAHGGGFIDGFSVTNSLEAVQRSIENGFGFIELDMSFTSDGQIAMIHDWQSSASYYLGVAYNYAISYEAYQNCKVMDTYQPLTMETLGAILAENPQVRIITDTKEDNIKLLTKIKEDYPQIAKQIIPQIYYYSEYEAVHKLGYEDIILTVYKMSTGLNAEEVTEFAKKNDIYAVTMSYELVDCGAAKILKDHGVTVYMHTINDLGQLEKAVKNGAYGIYTDDLLPEEIETKQSQYYLVNTDGVYEDQRINIALEETHLSLEMKGVKSSDYVNFLVGDILIGTTEVNKAMEVDTSLLEPGQHDLKAEVFDKKGNLIVPRDYLLWKNANSLLLTGKQYGYIAQQLPRVGNFEEAIGGYSNQVKSVLQNSFIAKIDSPLYYVGGAVGMYLNGTTLLTPIRDDSNNILIPLYDTAIRMGAEDVEMSGGRAMMIYTKDEIYTALISDVTTWADNHYTSVISTNLKLYRNKAMAGGNLYRAVFGRPYIQDRDVIVILPQGAALQDNIKKSVLEAAKRLYEKGYEVEKHI